MRSILERCYRVCILESVHEVVVSKSSCCNQVKSRDQGVYFFHRAREAQLARHNMAPGTGRTVVSHVSRLLQVTAFTILAYALVMIVWVNLLERVKILPR